MTGQPSPLILTALLDPAAQAGFDRLRDRYFPAALNHLAAHVTMFHHLPGAEEAAVRADLAACCQPLRACPFAVTEVRSLGRGVAYRLAMPEVSALRQRLAAAWSPWLTPQDRQKWTPHVTVQNKVDPAEARRTLEHLQASPGPLGGCVLGVQLWAYCGGPWEHVARFNFPHPG